MGRSDRKGQAKPGPDVYTALQLLSIGAILISMALLVLKMLEYGFKVAP